MLQHVFRIRDLCIAAGIGPPRQPLHSMSCLYDCSCAGVRARSEIGASQGFPYRLYVERLLVERHNRQTGAIATYRVAELNIFNHFRRQNLQTTTICAIS